MTFNINQENIYQKSLDLVMGLADFERDKTFPGHSGFHIERMELLLKKLGNPHLKIPTIHVAGTKGKGSTSAMISQILISQGYKVGLYSSPHLHSVRERIKVDSELISEQDFSNLVEEINKFYKKKIKNPYHKIKLKNANAIPINAIRDIKKKLYYTKSDENWSVVIISEAEKLCTKKAEAANSLLKILEEPPDKTLFILLTSKMNLLTPTILSRCQKQFFPKIEHSTLEEFMLKEKVMQEILIF